MRSQSKPLPKKGAPSKATVKTSPTKVTKKKVVVPKKTKVLAGKTVVKSPKKSSTKDEAGSSNTDEDFSIGETTMDSSKSGSSKTSSPLKAGSRSNSPTKKASQVKQKRKQKKNLDKTSPETKSKKGVPKKLTTKPTKTLKSKKDQDDNDEIKYKINLDVVSKLSKFSKAKKLVKKGILQNKKTKPQQSDNLKEIEKESDKGSENKQLQIKKDETPNNEPQKDLKSDISSNTSGSGSDILAFVTPKTGAERPPKFFTSSRPSRIVDIDTKTFKTIKFINKDQSKTDETIAGKSSNTLVCQGPDMDVYTFTEKVDSPKSIISDFRKSESKSIGKVRPIARVKGTVIDKKVEGDRNKYSSHRPIEEVVQQLIASKRSEDLSISTDNASASSMDSSILINKVAVEKPIVSKSYKMVARKTSIPGKPFSPIKFLDQESSWSTNEKIKKMSAKPKRQEKTSCSDDDLDTCKFSLNTKTYQCSSSEESSSESNDENETKESSESDSPKGKATRNKKYKKIAESKELRELSRDTLTDGDKPSKRRLKLLSMWSGPKKHRMASLNALAKVHCLYENESRSHVELGLMRMVDRPNLPSTSKPVTVKKKENKPKIEKEKQESTSESEYESKNNKKDDGSESSDTSDDNPPQRSLRGEPGIRSAGKYWDPRSCTSSSEDSEIETLKRTESPEKKKYSKMSPSNKSDEEKSPPNIKKDARVPTKKKRNRTEVVMDLKDMVVQKRMASLNATAILAASYEKRSPKSGKDETTSDSCSDESFSHKSKNVLSSGVKSEVKLEETKKEPEDKADRKVEVVVNQDTDVTITGVYSTHHHEGFCTVSGMQYRISSTSHTQTTATANCEKEGCSREEPPRYTPLSALSSMQPPADHGHNHPHPVPELGGLSRRPGCSSAFSAPSPSAHHDPGYYQPAGPLIKESGEADRALARYHPPPHYHPPHPPVLPQYPPYYSPELCYGQYYRRPGPYHMPPQPDPPMVGVGGEPYPPPQYYGTPPCYQHSPQRIPYVEYRGCPCPLTACPKNVLIGPATGKAPTGGGPEQSVGAGAPPGGAFRPKGRAARDHLGVADLLASGKDPPLESEPPAAADAPHPCPVPAIGGASPKRELFDGRDNLRLAGELAGAGGAPGPPSPARGSAGVCAPQPPTVAPRRARLGKAMARRSLAGDDTGLLMSAPQPPPAHHSDADDDVLAISPPLSAPIDLSSSDERSTPLVDVKKENEGPIYTITRKTDAQALREHNNTAVSENTDAAKPVKRRYSRPKLEIDMNNTQLEESLKTNGIGEHVKLQKRRKVSGDQTNVIRVESVAKEPKKRTPQSKRTPKTPNEKKSMKRKSDGSVTIPKAKRMLIKPSPEGEAKNKNIAATPEDLATKPKIKSALLLDNLIRKNSVDAKGYASDKELNPAELFLTPMESPNKKTNINNNIVGNSPPISGVRPNTIAAVTQLIEKKLAYKKACKLEKVDSKIMHSSKSVLNAPVTPSKCKSKCDKESDNKSAELSDKVLSSNSGAVEDAIKSFKVSRVEPKLVPKRVETNAKLAEESHTLSKNVEESNTSDKIKSKDQPRGTPTKVNGQMKNKSIEKVAKLLGSKKPIMKVNILESSGNQSNIIESIASKINENSVKRNRSAMESEIEKAKSIERVAKLLAKPSTSGAVEEKLPISIETVNCRRTSVEVDKDLRKHSNGELKPKHAEKVAKLMVSKRPTIKTDEALEVVEDACASPLPAPVGRRARRRRSGASARRVRRPPALLAPPAAGPTAAPRWSNGWEWDGDSYISQVYLNNDSRLDRTARCWQRMTHASGDTIGRGDCVLLRASTAKAQPFVARVASLWENTDDGEMMVSLVWYYRPEHTERGRVPSDAPDEVFASRHRDANSVACIEDKCYVLTFNEYCRYRKRLKAAEERVKIAPSIVPPLPASEYTPLVAPKDSQLPPNVSPDLVMFCRKIYDFRLKKLLPPSNK